MSKPLTLAELIRQHQDRTGDSYAVIARRAGLSKAKIGQLAQPDGHHMPRVDTLEKVAVGLGLPLRIIQQAALTTAGIAPESYDNEQKIDHLVAVLRELPPEDLETATMVVQAMRQRRADG